MPENKTQTRYPQTCLGACLLPWTSDFELDTKLLEEHIDETLAAGYTCLYILGTASEGYALSDGGFREVAEIFAARTVKEGNDPEMAVLGTSMRQTIERIGIGYDLGVRMFQVAMPSWGTLAPEEALTFFKDVCGSFPDCRFLHYNALRQGRQVRGEEYRRVADEVPNLVATKTSGYDYAQVADLITHVPDLQHFLLENNFAMGCTLGECSLLCSYDVLFPQTTHRFYEAGKRRDLEELFRYTKLFYDVDRLLFGHVSGPHIDPAFDKTLAWLHDPRFSNRLLPPYHGLSVEESARCRRIFEEHFSEIR